MLTSLLAVTALLKVLMAYTVKVWLKPLLPKTVLPVADRAPLTVSALLTVTAAFATTGLLRLVAAYTVKFWLPLMLPKVMFPLTVTGPVHEARTSAVSQRQT